MAGLIRINKTWCAVHNCTMQAGRCLQCEPDDALAARLRTPKPGDLSKWTQDDWDDMERALEMKAARIQAERS